VTVFGWEDNSTVMRYRRRSVVYPLRPISSMLYMKGKWPPKLL